MYCRSEKLRLEIHKKALSFRKRRKITLCVILDCIKMAMEGQIYSLFHLCWLPKWITGIKGRAGMLSAALNAAWISLPLKPQQQQQEKHSWDDQKILNRWEKWFITPRSQTEQFVNLQIFQICAKAKLQAQEQLQISKWEGEWFVPFLLFIVPFGPRIPNCPFPGMVPTPHSYNIGTVWWFHHP